VDINTLDKELNKYIIKMIKVIYIIIRRFI